MAKCSCATSKIHQWTISFEKKRDFNLFFVYVFVHFQPSSDKTVHYADEHFHPFSSFSGNYLNELSEM